jgi:hypothetical protein
MLKFIVFWRLEGPLSNENLLEGPSFVQERTAVVTLDEIDENCLRGKSMSGSLDKTLEARGTNPFPLLISSTKAEINNDSK